MENVYVAKKGKKNEREKGKGYSIVFIVLHVILLSRKDREREKKIYPGSSRWGERDIIISNGYGFVCLQAGPSPYSGFLGSPSQLIYLMRIYV
jgi:hypothetical protein